MGMGGAEEADYAVHAMNDLGCWGHKLVIDAEKNATPDGVLEAIRQAKRLLRPTLWLYRNRLRVGIYSGYWVKSHGGGTFGADFGWLADYNPHAWYTERPAGWSESFTKLWQFTSNEGRLDEDYWMADGDYTKFFAPIDRKGRRL